MPTKKAQDAATPATTTPAKTTAKKPAAKKPATKKTPAKKPAAKAPAKAAAKKAPARKTATAKSAGSLAEQIAEKAKNANDSKMARKKTPRENNVVLPHISEALEASSTEGIDTSELSPQDIAFCEYYLTTFNGTQSYLACYSPKSESMAAHSAHHKLKKPNIRRYIEERLRKALADADLSVDKLLQTYHLSAYGDINELVQYRRNACRYCYGTDHKYQFTPQGMRDHKAKHAEKVLQAKRDGIEAPEFDPLGGTGYDPRLEPHEDCPECHGNGVGGVHFADTRTLSPAGRALYAGAKVGKDGIEVKTNSQERAREMLARVLKLFEDKTEVTVSLDMETLEEKFAKKMREAHERQAKVIAERNGVDGE